MIQDKAHLIRMVKQLSEQLNRLILENNESELPKHWQSIETQIKDIFQMNFDSLSALSNEEIVAMVESKEPSYQAAYIELLGHLFYLNRTNKKVASLQKSMFFYGLYLQKSGIFSLPIINRINELKNISHGITNG